MIYGYITKSQGPDMVLEYKIQTFPYLIFFYEGIPYKYEAKISE